MKKMTMRILGGVLDGVVHCPREEIADKEIQGVVIDNRGVMQDYLFIPIRGKRVDGHTFIPSALRAGALFVLSDHRLEDETIPYIEVDDTPKALCKIATYYRSTLTIPVIGIVGSVGKTSTKEMVASVLSEKYNALKTEGNFNNEIGLPLTLLRIKEEHEAAVVEMGISDFGEMDRLGSMAKPSIVVMTNIGECHLEFLGDRAGVLKAKTEIFSHLADDAKLVLNADDDMLSTIKNVKGATITRYGIHGGDVVATKVSPQGLHGITVDFKTAAGNNQVTIPMPGEHNVYNAMAAVAVGQILDMDIPSIVEGIKKIKSLQGRSNFLYLQDGVVVIDDCYNANPASMKASLQVLSQASGRKIAVLGDMGELGNNEKVLHFEIGEFISKLPIQYLFTAGPLAKQIAQGISTRGGKCRVRSFDTRDAMTLSLLKMIEPGDTILVKASHFMEFDHVVEDIKSNVGL